MRFEMSDIVFGAASAIGLIFGTRLLLWVICKLMGVI